MKTFAVVVLLLAVTAFGQVAQWKEEPNRGLISKLVRMYSKNVVRHSDKYHTPDGWKQIYLQEPGLMLGKGALSEATLERWSKQNVLDLYGEEEVLLKSKLDLHTFTEKRVKLKDYLKDMGVFDMDTPETISAERRWVMKDTLLLSKKDILRNAPSIPQALVRDLKRYSEIEIGGTGTGFVEFLTGDRLSVLVYGMRHWFLWSTDDLLTQHMEDLPFVDCVFHMLPGIKYKLDSYEVIQDAGQAIYIPEGYYAVAINIGEVVAFNTNGQTTSTKIKQMQRADAAFNSGNFLHAASLYQRLIQQHETWAYPYMQRAEALSHLRFVRNAQVGISYFPGKDPLLVAVQRAIEVYRSPNYLMWDAFWRLAFRDTEATHAFKNAELFSKTMPEIYTGKMMALIRDEKYTAAIAAADTAVSLYQAQGRHREAAILQTFNALFQKVIQRLITANKTSAGKLRKALEPKMPWELLV